MIVWRSWFESLRNREDTLANRTIASGLVSTHRSQSHLHYLGGSPGRESILSCPDVLMGMENE